MLVSTNMVGTPRPIIGYNRFLSNVKRRILKATLQYTDVEFLTSESINFVTSLLTTIHTPSALTDDMFDVYMDTILDASPTVKRKFDIVMAGKATKTNTFIKGNTTEEIYIPTKGIVGKLANIADGWDVWKDIAPIKLVAVDSQELTLEWYHQITYTKDIPTYAVFAIDVNALLTKYIIYLRHNGIGLENPKIYEFINREIIPFMYYDVLETWISNFILDTINGINLDKKVTIDIISDSDYKTAIDDVNDLYDRLIRGNLKIGDFFKTYFYDGKSILNMITTYDSIYDEPNSRRYFGYTLLKMADITDMFVNIIKNTKKRGLLTTYIRKLKFDYTILSRSRWETHMPNQTVIARVRKTLDNIKEVI